MKDAMRAKDQARLSTIRLILATVKDRDIALRGADDQEGLTEAGIRELLGKMIKQRDESAATYDEAGRLDLAESERAEIEVIRSFLPRQLSDEDTRKAIAAAIEETGATSIRDMGRIMGILKSKYAGQMDFGKVGAEVKTHLG